MTAKELLAREAQSMGRECQLRDSAVLSPGGGPDMLVILYEPTPLELDGRFQHTLRWAVSAGSSGILNTWWSGK